MTETRLQRLEALLARVRRRAAEPRSRIVAAEPAAPEPARLDVNAPVTAPPISGRVEVSQAPRSLPVQAPESGWPEAPSPPSPGELAAASAQQTAELEVVENPPLETLDEDDLLEIPSDRLESIPPSGGVEAREEEPPASSQRPKAGHLEDLESASAALAAEEEREVPIKTPPPESGPQAAPPPSLGAPPAPDVDALLEADIAMPSASAEQLTAPFDSLEQPFGTRPPPPASGPTVEQLGQTIELEEAPGPELELDRPLTPPAVSAAPDELEASLPAGQSAGAYHEALMPPPQAEQELEAHRERFGAAEAPAALPSAMPEIALGAVPPLATMPAASATASSPAPMPELVLRPPLSAAGVMTVSGTAQKSEPRTFLQLLDASIALGN